MSLVTERSEPAAPANEPADQANEPADQANEPAERRVEAGDETGDSPSHRFRARCERSWPQCVRNDGSQRQRGTVARQAGGASGDSDTGAVASARPLRNT